MTPDGYTLTSPCSNCPFRTDLPAYLRRDRAEQIVGSLVDAEFPCHKTVDYDEDGSGRETEGTKHCAGALIMLEKMEQPSQMMRICERLGMYDRSNLNMDAPVFDDAEEFIEAQPH